MALSLQTWRTQYPEFASAPDALVQAYLDRALARIDASVWGTLADQGQGLLAAHTLALAPNGQFARLTSEKGETTYGRQFARLEAQVTIGLRVI
jgi:hypothetical protein